MKHAINPQLTGGIVFACLIPFITFLGLDYGANVFFVNNQILVIVICLVELVLGVPLFLKIGASNQRTTAFIPSQKPRVANMLNFISVVTVSIWVTLLLIFIFGFLLMYVIILHLINLH